YGIRNIIFVHNREGFTPIALATEAGVSQAIVNPRCAYIFVFQSCNYGLCSLRDAHSADKVTIFDSALFITVCSLAGKAVAKNISDGNVEMLRKSKISIIARRYGHDGPRAISGQYIF